MQKLTVTLTNPANGQTCKVRAEINTRILAGMPHFTERQRRTAFKKIGADWQDPRSPVTASCALRAIDANGWNQFTIWDKPATMKPFIFEHWHAWEGEHQVILSDESTKSIRYFEDTDKAINWLFLNGQKPAARALNSHVKAG